MANRSALTVLSFLLLLFLRRVGWVFSSDWCSFRPQCGGHVRGASCAGVGRETSRRSGGGISGAGALPLISAAGRPSLRCPMGVSKHQGPQRRPQIVGFLLQGHPQTGPSICGNNHIRIRSRVPLEPPVPQGSLLRAPVDLLTQPLLPNPSPRNHEILSSASVLLISLLQCAARISSLLTPFLFAQHLCASGLTAQGGIGG